MNQEIRDVLVQDDCPPTAEFLDDVLAGMSRRAKWLPCKYFYDERGCDLFDRICELDEYYPTRTELAIMRQHVGEMAREIGPACMLIEYGSGASVKTRLLLDHLPDATAYVPVDIARDYLEPAAEQLQAEYPQLEVLPVWADFAGAFEVPACADPVRRRVAYFPGSTIGNFATAEAEALLAGIVDVCGPGGGLLIGIDLKKDAGVIEAAYNDRQGVTAEFNCNLLRRINRELDADFRLERFRHHAFYNEPVGRVEMHLVSQADQQVTIADQTFSLETGETICTEYSHKYELGEFARLAETVGLSLRRHWTDRQQLFAVLFLTVAAN